MNYLEKKTFEKFSGCIKLNCQHGEISVIETNAVDIPLSPISDYKKILSKIKSHDYSGTVVFEYKSGEITRYAYTRHIPREEIGL